MIRLIRDLALFSPTKAFAVAALPFLVACSDPPLSTDQVHSYWQAVADADWATAWQMERNRVTKAENPLDYYQRMKSTRIAAFRVGESQVDAEGAVVDLEYDLILPIADGRYTKPMKWKDHWVYADGQWWHSKTATPSQTTKQVEDGNSAESTEIDEARAEATSASGQ